MICPRCGENNPDNYRFCGMCGDTLQGPVPVSNKSVTEEAGAANRPESLAFSRMENRGASKGATIVAEPSRTGMSAPHTDERVEPIAGPSLLGLNQPTPDSIRETTFKGMTTYYPEERGVAWGRIFLTLIFIAGLVAVGWWRYKNYGIPGHGGAPSWLSAMNRTVPPSDNSKPEFGKSPRIRVRARILTRAGVMRIRTRRPIRTKTRPLEVLLLQVLLRRIRRTTRLPARPNRKMRAQEKVLTTRRQTTRQWRQRTKPASPPKHPIRARRARLLQRNLPRGVLGVLPATRMQRWRNHHLPCLTTATHFSEKEKLTSTGKVQPRTAIRRFDI